MDAITTRIESMEHTARNRGIARLHNLNDNEQVMVSWHHVSKRFQYCKVDKRKVRAGVHNLDGFTDLTREQAAELLA